MMLLGHTQKKPPLRLTQGGDENNKQQVILACATQRMVRHCDRCLP